MLLGYADIEAAFREFLAEHVEAGARRHRRCDANNERILLGDPHHLLREHLGVARRPGLRLGLLACHNVELGDAMILVIGALGGVVTLSLLRHDVDQNRPVRHVARILQHVDKRIHVVPVNRADIVEAERVEHVTAHVEAADRMLRLLHNALDANLARHALGELAHFPIALRGHRTRQVVAHRANRRGDRHVVIVEDYDQRRVHRAGIVHSLIDHARAHRAVADHRDHAVVAVKQVARHGKTGGCGNRRARVSCAERIVLALVALGEAGEAAALAQRPDARTASRQDLVRIGLVADVPDQPVGWRVEHGVDGDCQLDHAQTGAEVTAGHRHGADRLCAQLVGDLA